MLVVNRFTVVDWDPEEFLDRSRDLLETLAAQPGYQRGWVGRAADSPGLWMVASEWANVGSYRRALSSYDVKVTGVPLLSLAHDEPSAFEVMYSR
jgi:quinol monooxygenase YgiN